MDFVYKVRDSVVGYLSPAAKRRRTTGPLTPIKDEEPMFDAPTSEPQGSKAQAVVVTRVSKKYIANPRKRAYQEDEEETVITVKPEDSASQIGPIEEAEGQDVVEKGQEEDGDDDSDDDEDGDGDDDDDEDGDEDGNEDEDGSETDELDPRYDDGEAGDLHSEEEDLEADKESSNAPSISSDVVDEEEIEEEEETPQDEAEISAKEAAAAEARVNEYLARQAELALRREDIEKAKAAGDWHPDAIVLFERLSLRSFEEVLPKEYQIDFPTLPEDIFAPYGTETFINYNCRPHGSAIRALQGLLRLGVRAREKLEAVGSAEKLIAKSIRDYVKWSERDGGFDRLRFLPVLVVVAARPKQSTETISAAIEDQMRFLAQRHREYLALPTEHTNELGEVENYRKQPPLLYGIIVARTMVIFVTMDSAKPESKVKHLTHFDFKDKPMDVWNGFAIAYMVIMARNYSMSIKDELEEEPEEEDPDL